jgi:pimeloyl-ACP methyl ester carboxylesterase
MSDSNPLDRRAASNLEAVKIDLAASYTQGDDSRTALLQTLLSSGGRILLYRPQLQHYAVLFGDLDAARHVALVVPGVGDGTNMCDDWIPGAMNLYVAAADTAVVLWKGYDNPLDIFDAATESIECSADLMAAGSDLVAFVDWLDLADGQSLTVVAHSFGSVVTGTALADHGLRPTDVVVAGSPGMTVDELRQLHVETGHFFSEKAPGDAVAELGIFGAAPTSSTFGGTRMRTNALGHGEVLAHSHYFEAGSEALENMVAVVTGRYADVHRHVWSVPEIAGGLVCWTLRLPTVPVRIVGRHYRGPGFRVMTNAVRLCDLGAAQTGNLVREALDEGERVVAWALRRAGGSWTPFSSPDGS